MVIKFSLGSHRVEATIDLHPDVIIHRPRDGYEVWVGLANRTIRRVLPAGRSISETHITNTHYFGPLFLINTRPAIAA